MATRTIDNRRDRIATLMIALLAAALVLLVAIFVAWLTMTASGAAFLVRQVGRDGDLWFHAQGLPGSHVILRMPSSGPSVDPPDAAIRQAAVLAAYFSRGRTNLKMNVDYIPFQRIRRPRRGHPGQVVFTGQKSVVVSPDEAESLLASLDEET